MSNASDKPAETAKVGGIPAEEEGVVSQMTNLFAKGAGGVVGLWDKSQELIGNAASQSTEIIGNASQTALKLRFIYRNVFI